MNSRTMHQIDIKNRVMADAWNCQKRYVTVDTQIINENWVSVDIEIVIENWVTTDVWNRQRKWIDDRCIKLVAKLDSWLTHGIVKNYVVADTQIVSENWVSVDIEIITENWVTANVWNRQRKWIDDRRIKLIAKMDSWLTHGIVKNVMWRLIHKSSAKRE
jgi:hypothetical protein